MEKSEIKDLIEVIYAAGDIVLPGYYNLKKESAAPLIELSLKTGVNALNIHTSITHLTWRDDGEYTSYCTESDLIAVKFAMEHADSFVGLDLVKILGDVERSLEAKRKNDEWRESYEFRRQQACAFTSNQTTRKKIFKRDGRNCKHCGSDKFPTIDHIVSVRDGGGNGLENLQVLCRSCNSKKGSNSE